MLTLYLTFCLFKSIFVCLSLYFYFVNYMFLLFKIRTGCACNQVCKKSLVGFFLLLQSLFIAQTQLDIESKHSALTKFDTNYIYKYESKLVIGPCISYRNYNMAIKPEVRFDDSIYVPNLLWRSPSNRFVGIDFSYDKFGFTFSVASFAPQSEQDLKGKSSSKSFGINYGGNRCFVETSFRTFQGFYERNTKAFDTTLTSYYQSPNLRSDMFNLKFWYFTNHHKFAFKSCYGGLYRQLKTRATWVFSANFHWNKLITDSSIVPDPDNQYYNNALNLKGIEVFGVSVFGGAAINFVIKRGFFVNLAYVAGPDFQNIEVLTISSKNNSQRQYANFAHDIKFATGFNLKKWYFTYTFSHEMNRFTSQYAKIRGRLNSLSFNLGYRFGIKKPALYAKFQNTWIYNAF